MYFMENQKFEQLVESYLKWKYAYEPGFASYLGLSSYDSLTGSFSPESRHNALINLYNFKSQAQNILTYDLNADNKIDKIFLLRDIELYLLRIEHMKHWEKNPQIYLDEALDGINTLMLKSFRPLEYTAEMILKKMESIPQLFREAKDNLVKCPPVFLRVSSQTALCGIEFMDTIKDIYGKISPAFEEDFKKASMKAREAISDFAFFLKTMEPGEEQSFATGKEIFSHLVRTGYMIDKDLDELLETGETCFASISEKLTELGARLDPDRSWYEIYRELKQENPGPSGVLRMYLDYMNDARDFLIKNDIVTVPSDIILDVTETPAFIRPLIPVAAYLSPGPYDEVQKGLFWVTPLPEGLSDEEIIKLTGEHNIYTAKVTAPHEAYPGHHLQLCMANRLKSPLRRIVHSNIFVEGWGLYCEEMMKEVGYLKGTKLELSQQVDQLMRAARVIIDIRLHTLGMNIEEAKSFLRDIVLVSAGTAEVEVNRYTMTPTQPMSYMLGQIEILKLREDFKKLKGSSFTLKNFHDSMLQCGSSPVKIMRHIILGEELE